MNNFQAGNLVEQKSFVDHITVFLTSVVIREENQKKTSSLLPVIENFHDQNLQSFFNWKLNIAIQSLHQNISSFPLKKIFSLITNRIQINPNTFLSVQEIKSKKQQCLGYKRNQTRKGKKHNKFIHKTTFKCNNLFSSKTAQQN